MIKKFRGVLVRFVVVMGRGGSWVGGFRFLGYKEFRIRRSWSFLEFFWR